MLAVGALLAMLAAALQSLTAARLAGLVLLIPVASIGWAIVTQAFAGSRGLRRDLTPATWQVDRPGSVRLAPTGRALPPWSSLRERVPASLRRRSSSPGGYGVLPSRRGRVRLGPAVLQRGDPLGIVTWRREIGGVTEILVWPRTAPVDQDVLARAMEASLPRPHGPPQRTIEDLTVREYRRGDDLHRIHWRSSARHGELMVRHDEPTTTRVMDVLLLLSEHEDDVAEWAVSAAASMTVALLHDGYTVRVVTVADGAITDSATTSTADALDVFAIAEPAGPVVGDALRVVARSTAAAIIAVVDRPTDEVARLVDLGAVLHSATALVVGSTDNDAPTPVALRRAGWVVGSAAGTEDLANAWRAVESEMVR